MTGVAVVIFITIYEIIRGGAEHLNAWNVLWLFVREAGGGVLLGVALGYAGYLLISSVDHYQVEVMLTLAVVTGGYLLADRLKYQRTPGHGCRGIDHRQQKPGGSHERNYA